MWMHLLLLIGGLALILIGANGLTDGATSVTLLSLSSNMCLACFILMFRIKSNGVRPVMAFNFYRILGGVGVGLASALCPMYIAEVAKCRRISAILSTASRGYWNTAYRPAYFPAAR